MLDLKLKTNFKFSDFRKYLSKDIDINRVEKAFNYAKKAHQNQLRKSGRPYFEHPLWIAKVAAQLKIDTEGVIAALLHDCVEDTPTTIDQVADLFGNEVALLVDGLTDVKNKTSKIILHQENIAVFRQFLVSGINDVRIIILRIIDKLHNGLTIESLTPEKKLKYATRVLGIYSPMAEYVGLHFFKRKLDDIAFEIVNKEKFDEIYKAILDQKQTERQALKKVKAEIKSILEINGVANYKIKSRIKSIFSTYNKLKYKKIEGVERIKDRVGIRVMVTDISECYTILSLLHSKYEYIESEFDDYIANPKENGYRSIQTTLKWDERVTVEVQIRTFEMDDFNEFGPASHVAYKIRKSGEKNVGMTGQLLKDLVKWQSKTDGVHNYKISVLTHNIYVFTPKGDVIQMDSGSTGLDFAFRLHTDIGKHCMGVKINNKIKKLNTELKTGDMVEILLGKKNTISADWLEYTKTKVARNEIRKYLYKKNKLSF